MSDPGVTLVKMLNEGVRKQTVAILPLEIKTEGAFPRVEVTEHGRSVTTPSFSPKLLSYDVRASLVDDLVFEGEECYGAQGSRGFRNKELAGVLRLRASLS